MKKEFSKGIAFRMIAMITLLAVFIIAVVLVVNYREANRQLERNFEHNISNTVAAAAMQVAGDQHMKIKTSAHMEGEEYQKLKFDMEALEAELDIFYIYTFAKEGENLYTVYSQENEVGEAHEWYSGMKEAFSGQIYCTEGYYTDNRQGQANVGVESVTLKSAYAPITNSAGEIVAIMAIGFNAENVLALRQELIGQLALPSAIILLVCIGAAIGFSRRLVGPLQSLQQSCRQMATGDFTGEIDSRGIGEMGLLAGDLNIMQDRLKELVQHLQDQAQSVAAHSQELAATSEEVNAGVEHVAGTTNEVANIVATSVENAIQVAQQSEATRQEAESGSRAIDESVDKINVIAGASKDVFEAIQELSHNSSQVSHISNTIIDIAEQTNMLALNAAIEAARAGDQGRGFAVVAEEVRQLAEGSAAASQEITELMQEIQSGVDNASTLIERAIGEVEEGVKVVNDTGHSLQQIIGMVDGNTTMSQNVATGSQQVNQDIQQLNTTVEQIAASIQQFSAASQSLAGIATDLHQTVDDFKIS